MHFISTNADINVINYTNAVTIQLYQVSILANIFLYENTLDIKIHVWACF